jgi:hypothetical protein
MTNSLDTIFGKVLDAVHAVDPNTYVIFISDNGTPMYGRPNLDFIDNMYITRKGRGKGTAYESGALVPMIIAGPKIAANTENKGGQHLPVELLLEHEGPILYQSFDYNAGEQRQTYDIESTHCLPPF